MQVEVTNVVKIIGSENELERLRKMVDVNELGFEFDSIVQQPEQLRKMNIDEELSVREEIELLSSCGAINIFEWRKIYWGTAWENAGTSWFSNSYIKMISINNSPIGIFRQLSLLFEVKLYVLYSSFEESGILTIEKGEVTEKKANDDEAEVIIYLIDEPNYTYEMWEKSHKNSTKRKKLNMKLLLNRDTEFLAAARRIIDQKTEPVNI